MGDRGDRPRRARVVDRQPAVLEARHGNRAPGCRFGRRHREASQAVVGIAEAPDRAVGVDREPHLGRPRSRFTQYRLPAKYVGAPARCNFGRPQHGFAAGPADRFDQGVVIADVCFVTELEVDGDGARAVAAQAIDHLRVIPARKRELRAQAQAPEFLERRVRNGHSCQGPSLTFLLSHSRK